MPPVVDVLVVGCGPAGASAAAEAAACGLSVQVIERRREVGLPVQCAEFVPRPLVAQARAGLKQAITGMHVCLPSGVTSWHEAPGFMIDRAAFDQALAAQALAAGARLARATALRALDWPARTAILSTPTGPARVGFRFLIAADGPLSTVARLLGLGSQPVVATRQYTVALPEPASDIRVWLSEDYPGGYAWLFPRGGVANLGVGLEGDGYRLKRRLDALHQALAREGRVGSAILRATGGPIPVGGLRARRVAGPVLFAGDAGGLAHPVTGAGIAVAVVSGQAAGRAAAAWLTGRERALQDYEDELADTYGPSLDRACRRRQALWAAPCRDDAAFRRAWTVFPEYFLEPGP